MIAVNKYEKEMVMGRFPDIGMVRTMKQDSKRHHYYLEERPDAMAFLRTLRGEPEPRRNKRHGGNNGYNKKNR